MRAPRESSSTWRFRRSISSSTSLEAGGSTLRERADQRASRAARPAGGDGVARGRWQPRDHRARQGQAPRGLRRARSDGRARGCAPGHRRARPDALGARRSGTCCARSEGTLKSVIADQSVIAGIGNAYSDEILHAAQLSPLRHANALGDDEVERLVDRDPRHPRARRWRSRSTPIRQRLKDGKRQSMRVHGRDRSSPARSAATPFARCRWPPVHFSTAQRARSGVASSLIGASAGCSDDRPAAGRCR